MKGLLLKDWYMMQSYCKSYLLIAVVFLLVSLFSDDNQFFVFYPCLLCGMIPVNLLSYDERSRWMQYSATLPCTRAQIVSAKYLIGLFTQLAILTATGIAQGCKMAASASFDVSELLILLLLLLTLSTVTTSISLPVVFKLGTERGRIAYYVMVGFVCAASMVAAGFVRGPLSTGADVTLSAGLVILAAVGVGIYALSWWLAILFFQKRDIS